MPREHSYYWNPAQKRRTNNRTKRGHDKAQVWLDNYKKGKSCARCGVTCNGFWGPESFDLHHKDPKKKRFMLRAREFRRYPMSEILVELDNCELVCSNCHRHITRHEKQNRRGLNRDVPEPQIEIQGTLPLRIQ